ncbi:hypothetical protein RUM43_001515 [Polyplax serrata]|uniref:Uncharacterized protein n=1 Tax=Polyplax serrata TaxID=468196 RepID=A0AAN8SEW7_POLSC
MGFVRCHSMRLQRQRELGKCVPSHPSDEDGDGWRGNNLRGKQMEGKEMKIPMKYEVKAGRRRKLPLYIIKPEKNKFPSEDADKQTSGVHLEETGVDVQYDLQARYNLEKTVGAAT